MKTLKIPAIFIIILFSGPLLAQQTAKPFVTYHGSVGDYLKRIQRGKQIHAFDASVGFGQWQDKAREALIELTGLKQMEKDLDGFTPKIQLGQAEKTNELFTRALCSMETEPGVVIPFYLLIPKDANPAQPLPLLICPHGHDKLGLHSYAGAFMDEKHSRKVLENQGDIGAQAARRGYVVIAPATRGLAEEVLVPDPKGRHGKRPCRAQLIHCLLAGRTPIGERVWDMQRLLDWAEKHPLIDPKRIAMTGNSGGGVLTAYTAAIDTRIRVAIPSCSFTSVMSAEGFIFHCDCCLVPKLRDWGDWKELGGLVAPRHLLIVHGVDDSLHHPPTVEKLAVSIGKIFQAAGVPDHSALKWGNSGHRFYPKKMWPFIEKGLR
jgi:dienelactone hydrolase